MAWKNKFYIQQGAVLDQKHENQNVHERDTVADDLHGEEEVVLQVAEEVGTAEECLEDRGQSLPPLLSPVHLHHTPQQPVGVYISIVVVRELCTYEHVMLHSQTDRSSCIG